MLMIMSIVENDDEYLKSLFRRKKRQKLSRVLSKGEGGGQSAIIIIFVIGKYIENYEWPLIT